MTAAVLEPQIHTDLSRDHVSDAAEDPKWVDDAVPLENPIGNAWDPDLAYSDANEWRWVPSDTLDRRADSWHALPAVVFLIVQSVLLVETVFAFISLQGQAWQPDGVLIIALLVMGLSASFLAGAAAAHTD